jgi:hypothetical protein
MDDDFLIRDMRSVRTVLVGVDIGRMLLPNVVEDARLIVDANRQGHANSGQILSPFYDRRDEILLAAGGTDALQRAGPRLARIGIDSDVQIVSGLT